MEEFEKKGEPARFARKRAEEDVWLGWIAIFLNIDDGPKFRTEMPVTGGHILHIGSASKSQIVHDEMKQWLGKFPGYFMIINRPMKRKFTCT